MRRVLEKPESHLCGRMETLRIGSQTYVISDGDAQPDRRRRFKLQVVGDGTRLSRSYSIETHVRGARGALLGLAHPKLRLRRLRKKRNIIHIHPNS